MVHFIGQTSIFLSIISALISASDTTSEGDRNPEWNIVYPEEAFLHAGGRIMDITKPPFNAKGDGITDNTPALVRAMNYARDKMIEHGQFSNEEATCYFYFPKGTYLVNGTITYEGPRVVHPKKDKENKGLSLLRIIGQSREETIIRLKDNCPGFGAGTKKPVLTYHKFYEDHIGSNIAFNMQLRNLTIDTGKGNPGAVGLVFLCANAGEVANVTIRSGDGSGHIGFYLPTWSVQGYMRDITVDGFDEGIRVSNYAESNPTLEYITLKNQRNVGIHVLRSSPCFRKLLSINEVSALKITDTAAQVVIIDSLLEGGKPDIPAMHLQETTSQLFARDVKVNGYGASVQVGEEIAVKGDVDEYVSGGVFSLFENQPMKSMGLPVEDTPLVPWEQDLTQWVNVENYVGANIAENIQNAMDSGKSTVYFPKGRYEDIGTIRIPASVKHIDFMGATARGSLTVEENSNDPLLIENVFGVIKLMSECPRTIIMRMTQRVYYINNQSDPIKIFMEACRDVGDHERFCPPNQKTWVRSMDNEGMDPQFRIYGGTIWVLGHKTEQPGVSFEVKNGGICEVLGGYRNETTPDQGRPMVRNENSHVSFVGYTSMNAIYEHGVWEIREGVTKKLMRSDFPQRYGYTRDFYIPLYVGYDPKVIE